MQLGTQMLKFHPRKAPEYWGLTFTAEQPNSTISMTKGSSFAPTLSLVTSVNHGRTWQTFTPGVTTITLAKKGASVWFAAGEGGNARTSAGNADSRANYFSMTGRISASGSVMSLLNASEPTYECVSRLTFSFLFLNCTSLTAAPELPATTLADYCYSHMFSGCTSLTAAPELPATTLASDCYNSMFSGCTSLTTAPELPATTLASSCYYYMFYGCTSLVSTPELPATTLATYCYYCMFSGCTSLTSAPALPAENLASYCYSYMFNGCTSLVAAPALSAETLATYCYQNMFLDCTSLTSAPVLPATTLASDCYIAMFSGCTSLTTAPSLPATTLTDYCYQSMFYHCTSLTTAPSLPATTLANSCYQQMFQGCTSLTTAPTLPAETLATRCYYYMFSGCTSLTAAPDLPAVDLVLNCYSGMFYGCSQISHVKIGALAFDGRTTDWLNGVSATGTFECEEFLGTNETIPRGASGCPTGWTVSNVPAPSPLTFTAGQAGSTVAMAKTGSPSVTPALYYKTYDGSTWSGPAKFTPGTTSVSLANVGSKVQFYGLPTNTTTASQQYITNYWHFTLSGSLAASGSMTSIVRAESAADYTFAGLFRGCTALTSAPDLPTTALTSTYCYANMFYGCTGLTTAPVLPATTLANGCYYGMFQGCTSLTQAPALPVETLAESCYYGMFSNCTSLASAPELPATTLVSSCYYGMFQGCTSLNTAPALPATTLAASCYRQMFQGCTSLTTTPALPATTLAASCYRQMFQGCTSLKQTPDLPATTANNRTYVYYRMFYNCTGLERTGRIAIATATGTSALAQIFYGCSSLKYIELSGMTAWSTRMANWVNGVAASGLFVCPSALGTESTITRGTANCPTGWTVANPVAYIAGNSQQSAYIETPYIPQTSDVVTAKIYRASSSNSWIFNTEDHWYGNTSAIGAGTSFGLGWSEPRMNFGKGWRGSATGWTSGLNDIRIEGQVLYVNNSQSVSMAGASLSGMTWLALLGNHRGGSVIECALPQHGIGRFTVVRNGTVIHDFVSVKIDNGTAVGAMIDKANLTGGTNNDGLYYNAGTGAFTIGPDA